MRTIESAGQETVRTATELFSRLFGQLAPIGQMRGPTPRHSPGPACSACKNGHPTLHTLFTLPTTTVFAALLPLPSRLCFRFFILLGVFESHCLITHPLQLPKNVCNNAYHWQDLVTPRQDRIRQSCKVVNCAIRHITVALNLHSSNCLLDFEVGDPHYRHYWSCP